MAADTQQGTRDGGFCTACGNEIPSFDGLNSCPRCGTESVPCSWSEQVQVSINWHELRILAIWAENWASKIEKQAPGSLKVVYSIASRLQVQRPAAVPLTLAGELGDIAAEYRIAVTDPRLRQNIAEQTGREVDLIRPQEDPNG